MKIIILFSLSLGFLSSCLFSNCKLKNLSSAEKEWFKIYRPNQLILFKSNLGSIDTFKVIQLVDKYTICNKLELSKFQYQEIHVRLSSSNDTGSFISLKFTKEYQDENNMKCIKYFDVYDMRGIYSDSTDTMIMKKVKTKFNNKEYLTVYFDVEKTNQFTKKINSFNWSKDLGLLLYKTSSNEVFELYKIYDAHNLKLNVY